MRLLLGTVVLAALAGPCAPPPPPTSVPSLDYRVYKQVVEPELMGSCGYSNCHGAAERPMRIYALAANRKYLNPPNDGLLEEESRDNFDRVRSFAAPTSAVLPDLLRKPLQLEAGGAGHTGVDRFGRNIYATKNEPGWKLLDDWVNGRLTWDAGPLDAGEPDAGTPVDGGSVDGGAGPTCAVQTPFGFAATVGKIVNVATCSDTLCHTPENIAARDAGCFDPSSCESIKKSGCVSPSVVGCNLFGSKLYRYTGVMPFYKSHQGKLVAQHAVIIGAWIDAGLPCD